MAIIFEIEHTTTRSAISSTRALREIQAQLLSLFNKKRALDRANDACRHQATIDVSSYPVETEVPFR